MAALLNVPGVAVALHIIERAGQRNHRVALKRIALYDLSAVRSRLVGRHSEAKRKAPKYRRDAQNTDNYGASA